MAYATTTRAARKGLLDRLAQLRDDMQTAIRQRRVYAQTVAQLKALSDRELADLGVSRLSIADIAREAAYGK
jgi:uncharacterized protein YjiS (DUF1127 family)